MDRMSDASDPEDDDELFRNFFEEPGVVNPLQIASRISNNLFDVIFERCEREGPQAPMRMRRRSYTEQAIHNSLATESSPTPAASGQRLRRASLTQHSVPFEQLTRQQNNELNAALRHRRNSIATTTVEQLIPTPPASTTLVAQRRGSFIRPPLEGESRPRRASFTQAAQAEAMQRLTTAPAHYRVAVLRESGLMPSHVPSPPSHPSPSASPPSPARSISPASSASAQSRSAPPQSRRSAESRANSPLPILGSVVGFGRATQTAPNSPVHSSPSATPRGRFRTAAERLTRGLSSRGKQTDAEASPQSVLNATFATPRDGVPQVDPVPPSPLAMNSSVQARAACADAAEATAPAAPAPHGFVRSRGKGASTLATSSLAALGLTVSSPPSTPSPPSASPPFAR